MDDKEPTRAGEEGSEEPKRCPPPAKFGRKVKQPCQLLRDLRAVWGQDETKDVGVGQQNARRMLKENSERFSRLLAQMEKEHRLGAKKDSATANSAEAGGGVAGMGVPDLGTEKCLALIEQLLKERGWEKA